MPYTRVYAMISCIWSSRIDELINGGKSIATVFFSVDEGRNWLGRNICDLCGVIIKFYIL